MTFVLTCYHSTDAPMGPLRMWEQVLHNVIHKVKTGFGISTDGYSYSDSSPIHGPGQGLRDGPGSCSTATSLLIDAMTRLCHGIQLCNPSQQTLFHTSTMDRTVPTDSCPGYTNPQTPPRLLTCSATTHRHGRGCCGRQAGS
jgi:hypothetical protein